MRSQFFDQVVDEYDAWYDTEVGAALYRAELEALRPLTAESALPRIEVGVGTGRFAAALGIEYGVDPALEPLRIAKSRNVQGVVATGEWLPFRAKAFGSVVFVFTLCFVGDPLRVLREAKRVLRPGGALVLGVVPADGPLGHHYRKLGDEGHRIYSRARFFTRKDLQDLLKAADLVPGRIRSSQIRVADGEIEAGDVNEGDHQEAGFLVISARKTVDESAISSLGSGL